MNSSLSLSSVSRRREVLRQGHVVLLRKPLRLRILRLRAQFAHSRLFPFRDE